MLDNISLLNLIWVNLNFLITHIVIELISLDFVWLEALSRHAGALRMHGLLTSSRYFRWVLVSIYQGAIRLQLNLLNRWLACMVLTGPTTREILTPGLVPSLINLLYVSIFILLGRVSIRNSISVVICCCWDRSIMIWWSSMIVLDNLDAFLFTWTVFWEGNFLLRNDNISTITMTILSFTLRCIWCCYTASFRPTVTLFLLLYRHLSIWVLRVEMVCHKGIGKLISGNGHRQKLWNSIWKKGFLENFAHAWAFMRLFNKHFSYDSLQVIRVCWGYRWIISSQNLQNETFHWVSIKSVP